MEKIIAINEIVEGEGCDMEGFEVVTNKQKIKLLINNFQRCCENFGYFWCNDDEKEFIGAELFDVTITDKALNKTVFEKNDTDKECTADNMMFVDLKTDKGILQFVAYNEHNGYYGHKAKVSCEQLEHTEVL